MATFSDDFNRADAANLGGNWTDVVNGWDIISNEAGPGTAATCISVWSTACDSDDNYSEVTFTNQSSGNSLGVVARWSNAAENGYLWRHNRTSAAQILKCVSGTYTALGSAYTVSLSIPDTARLECSGSTITGFWNATQAQQVTDTSVTTGLYVGFRSATTSNRVDDWSGGDLSSGDAEFTTVVGEVTAAGGSSTFTGGATFTTVVGEVTASGGSSTFTGGAEFTTVVGEVTASGGTSTFDDGNVEFTTVVGVVTASGGESTFDDGVETAGGGPVRRPMWWPEEPKKPKVRVDAKFVTLAGEVTASGGVSTFNVVPYSLTVDGDMRQVLELLELV